MSHKLFQDCSFLLWEVFGHLQPITNQLWLQAAVMAALNYTLFPCVSSHGVGYPGQSYQCWKKMRPHRCCQLSDFVVSVLATFVPWTGRPVRHKLVYYCGTLLWPVEEHNALSMENTNNLNVLCYDKLSWKQHVRLTFPSTLDPRSQTLGTLIKDTFPRT